jgi:hypothetical protein
VSDNLTKQVVFWLMGKHLSEIHFDSRTLKSFRIDMGFICMKRYLFDLM